MEISQEIKPGLVNELTFQVEEEYLAKHVGSGAMRVLATPSLILFMERACHRLLAAHLPPGSSSVGVHVDVRHLAPTPFGETVRVHCEVLEVAGPRVTFAVEAWDEQEKVGVCRHQRVIIDEERFLERVQKKIDQLSAAQQSAGEDSHADPG
jgi:predicted thioesterase